MFYSYRKLKVNSRLYKRKIKGKITLKGLTKYSASEIPGYLASYFSAAAITGFVLDEMDSNVVSAAAGTVAGDIGLLFGKAISYGLLHYKDYMEDKDSALENAKSIAESVGVQLAADLPLVGIS